MFISIANFSQMAIDRENIAISNKFKVAYGLCIGIFLFDIDQF